MCEEGNLPNWLTGAEERRGGTRVLRPRSDGKRASYGREVTARASYGREVTARASYGRNDDERPLPPQGENSAPAQRDLAWLDELAAQGAGAIQGVEAVFGTGDSDAAVSPGDSAQARVRPALRDGAEMRVTRVSSANAHPPQSAIRPRVSATPPPDTTRQDLPGNFTFQRLPAWWQETFARRRAPQSQSEWLRE